MVDKVVTGQNLAEVRVGEVSEFDDDARLGVIVHGREVFVFRHKDNFYAYENRCAHSGGPVGEGTIIGRVVSVIDENGEFVEDRFSEQEYHLVCPWHGYEYNIETGICAPNPRLSLRKYEVHERDGFVYVSGKVKQ